MTAPRRRLVRPAPQVPSPDPRRLQRVARVLERHALRAQKSVFLFRGGAAALGKLLDEAARHMDREADALQAWRLAPGQQLLGEARGRPLPVQPPWSLMRP